MIVTRQNLSRASLPSPRRRNIVPPHSSCLLGGHLETEECLPLRAPYPVTVRRLPRRRQVNLKKALSEGDASLARTTSNAEVPRAPPRWGGGPVWSFRSPNRPRPRKNSSRERGVRHRSSHLLAPVFEVLLPVPLGERI